MGAFEFCSQQSFIKNRQKPGTKIGFDVNLRSSFPSRET